MIIMRRSLFATLKEMINLTGGNTAVRQEERKKFCVAQNNKEKEKKDYSNASRQKRGNLKSRKTERHF